MIPSVVKAIEMSFKQIKRTSMKNYTVAFSSVLEIICKRNLFTKEIVLYRRCSSTGLSDFNKTEVRYSSVFHFSSASCVRKQCTKNKALIVKQ